MQLWFIGETEHDSPNKHSAHKSLSFDVLRYVQGRRVKLHLCWEAGREVVCSALIQHISQKAFCSWKRPKTTCFSSLIKERKGCTILFLLHHISNINPILDRVVLLHIFHSLLCVAVYMEYKLTVSNTQLWLLCWSLYKRCLSQILSVNLLDLMLIKNRMIFLNSCFLLKTQ